MKNPHRSTLCGSLALTGALCSMAAAQPGIATQPLFNQKFENDIGGWVALGEVGKATLTQEPANVKEGNGALQFDYPIKAGQFAVLLTPTPDGLPRTTKSFRFWVKSDYATSLTLAVQEQNGGRYMAIFHVPNNTWQRVEIEPADFTLADDANDPKDPNNKLDLERVEGVAVADLNQILIQNAQIAQLLGIQPGQHTFYLDELSISDEVLPATLPAADGSTEIDVFNRPQLSWIAVGEMRLSLVNDKVLEGAALQVDYRQAPERLAGVMKPFRRGKLVGMKSLKFNMASLKPATIVVQLEETGGGKYNAILQVPGDTQPQDTTLAFTEFKPADDSKDANTRLDLDQVKQVLFLDAIGFLGGAAGNNTLLINQLRAAP